MNPHADAIKTLERIRDLAKDGLNRCHRLGVVESDYRTQCEQELAATTLAIDALKAETYSVEDIEKWVLSMTGEEYEQGDATHPQWGIAAWKAAQLAGRRR